LCKITVVLILNRRTDGDRDGKITFYNAIGTSVIDYVLANNSSAVVIDTVSICTRIIHRYF